MDNMSGFNNKAEYRLSAYHHILKLCQINFISTHKHVLYAISTHKRVLYAISTHKHVLYAIYMKSYQKYLTKKNFLCKYYHSGILEQTLSVLS